MTDKRGKVFLVGAGPGARDLITVRGLECLRRADVVLHDDLVNLALLDEAPAAAERLHVGKRGTPGATGQEEISRMLVARAAAGQIVVRLKGGDPFVFGRGGDEAMALAAADIPYEVVPGVSAAIAVPACAGIPLTQRGVADGFEVWTGHDPDAARGKTAIVLMATQRLPENVARLKRLGYGGELPAALIEQGTLPTQRTVTATLDTIAEAAADVESPAVLVVGETVALRDKLCWFEARPLFGRRVLVTRARDQASETCRLLEELGAETVVMPTIALRPVADLEPLRRAVRQLAAGAYRYVILTSANAVEPLRAAVREAGLDGRAFAGATICAIGPGTAAALAALGLCADLVPEDHRAEGILAALPAELAGARVLLPRAAVARELLPEELAARGARVDLVPVYETGVPGPAGTRAGLEELRRGVDVLMFTSASTVENFAALAGAELGALCAGAVVAAIGPVTRDACIGVGLAVDVMPETYTLPALVEALVAHLRR